MDLLVRGGVRIRQAPLFVGHLEILSVSSSVLLCVCAVRAVRVWLHFRQRERDSYREWVTGKSQVARIFGIKLRLS